MRLLLDTHSFLWWVADDERLPARARDSIAGGEVLFSAASGWELAIKSSLGRIEVPRRIGQWVSRQISVNGFEVLPVHLRHAWRVAELPDHHRDPFDRMLVAQAMEEGLALVSGDRRLSAYDVEIVWE
jgi:PIN domain nuclease of toxin-antitoxin system